MHLTPNALRFACEIRRRCHWPRWHTSLKSWRPAWVSDRRIRQLQPSISCHQEALLRFGHESDEEFTALAVELSRLHAMFSELREQSAALDLVVQGHDEERASDAAYQLYKSSIDLVH